MSRTSACSKPGNGADPPAPTASTAGLTCGHRRASTSHRSTPPQIALPMAPAHGLHEGLDCPPALADQQARSLETMVHGSTIQ